MNLDDGKHIHDKLRGEYNLLKFNFEYRKNNYNELQS